MALNWEWTDKMGEITIDGYNANLYKGNALCIAVGEKDDTYWLIWFAADKDHLKNMLGLTPGYEECFSHFNISKFKLNTAYKESKQIIDLIIKAKIPMEFELY